MKSPALTELETRLASPDGKTVRDELTARLHALENRLRVDMAKGLSRDAYAAWQAAVNAALAAQEVLERHPVATEPASSSPVPAPFSIPSPLR